MVNILPSFRLRGVYLLGQSIVLLKVVKPGHEIPMPNDAIFKLAKSDLYLTSLTLRMSMQYLSVMFRCWRPV